MLSLKSVMAEYFAACHDLETRSYDHDEMKTSPYSPIWLSIQTELD